MFDRVTRAVQAKKTQQDTQQAEGMGWLRRNEVGGVVSPLSRGSIEDRGRGEGRRTAAATSSSALATSLRINATATGCAFK